MSYIFDALQRSQSERANLGSDQLATALELLERAEREAVAQRGSAPPQGDLADHALDNQGPLLSGEGFGPGATDVDLIALTGALQDEQKRETFSHFQDLEVAQVGPSSLVCLADSNCPATEAFHLLGLRIFNLRKEREFKSLLITSTVPKEGKSVVAANLACTLGSSGKQKVLLLEGDVRRPTQSGIFGLAQVPGLCNYLTGKRSLTACIYRLPKAGIWIMPASDNRGDIRELLQSPQLPELMKTLNRWFDWIVIDSPPVLPLVDTSIWARLADRILIVARHGTTKKRELQKGLEALDMNKVLHAVLNSSDSTADGYDYYYGRASAASEGQGMAID
jgi:capsular exopolysaccharide synthesis family protein